MTDTALCLILFLGYAHGSMEEKPVSLAINNVNPINEKLMARAEMPTAPPILNFTHLDGNQIPCMLAQFSGELRPTKGAKLEDIFIYGEIDTSGSYCKPMRSQLNIKWGDNLILIQLHRVVDQVKLSEVMVTLNRNVFTNNKIELNLNPIGSSFQCDSGLEIHLTNEANGGNMTLVLKNVKIDSFRNKFDPTFQPATGCPADDNQMSSNIPAILATILVSSAVIGALGYFGYRIYLQSLESREEIQ